jgi:hypothetical protein
VALPNPFVSQIVGAGSWSGWNETREEHAVVSAVVAHPVQYELDLALRGVGPNGTGQKVREPLIRSENGEIETVVVIEPRLFDLGNLMREKVLQSPSEHGEVGFDSEVMPRVENGRNPTSCAQATAADVEYAARRSKSVVEQGRELLATRRLESMLWAPQEISVERRGRRLGHDRRRSLLTFPVERKAVVLVLVLALVLDPDGFERGYEQEIVELGPRGDAESEPNLETARRPGGRRLEPLDSELKGFEEQQGSIPEGPPASTGRILG